MNLVELTGALRRLRLGGMADVLETRLLQARTHAWTQSICFRRSSATNSCGVRTACMHGASKPRPSANFTSGYKKRSKRCAH